MRLLGLEQINEFGGALFDDVDELITGGIEFGANPVLAECHLALLCVPARSFMPFLLFGRRRRRRSPSKSYENASDIALHRRSSSRSKFPGVRSWHRLSLKISDRCDIWRHDFLNPTRRGSLPQSGRPVALEKRTGTRCRSARSSHARRWH